MSDGTVRRKIEDKTIAKKGSTKLNIDIPWEIVENPKSSKDKYTLFVNGKKNYSDDTVEAIVKNWKSISNSMKNKAKKAFGAWIK